VATIIFTATHQRVTVTGPCLEEDLAHLVDAVEAFGRTCPRLVLDVTRVGLVSRPVAESILGCCARLEAQGRPVIVRARPESAVERMFEVVRDDMEYRRAERAAG
jgi:hypothetical protein